MNSKWVNYYPLSENWTPPEILIREKQLNELLNSIRSPYPNNYWIFGNRGLGKTLIARVTCQLISKSYYISCSSSFKESIRMFALKNGIEPKSYEGVTTTILRVIESKNQDNDNKYAVIFFDDVDKLAGGTFKRDLGLYLHDLYDRLLEEDYIFSINLITTVSYNEIKKYFSPPAMSRLKFKPLFFPNYNRDEIFALLKQRLSYIKTLEYDEEAIETIAYKVSRIGGDFRKALEITRNSITQDGKITLESVEKAWTMEKTRFWKSQILELPYHAAIILGCIIEETVRRHQSREAELPYFPVSWDRVKDRYIQKMRQFGIKPQENKMLYYWLEQLWMKGWIDKFALSRRHEWNYTRKRGLYLRLKEKLSNLIPAIQEIDWANPW